MLLKLYSASQGLKCVVLFNRLVCSFFSHSCCLMSVSSNMSCRTSLTWPWDLSFLFCSIVLFAVSFLISVVRCVSSNMSCRSCLAWPFPMLDIFGYPIHRIPVRLNSNPTQMDLSWLGSRSGPHLMHVWADLGLGHEIWLINFHQQPSWLDQSGYLYNSNLVS